MATARLGTPVGLPEAAGIAARVDAEDVAGVDVRDVAGGKVGDVAGEDDGAVVDFGDVEGTSLLAMENCGE